MEGDVLTCTSDGFPKLNYTWTETNGVVVSNANTTTLPGGWFNLTCIATINLVTPCSVNITISGFAVGKKTNKLGIQHHANALACKGVVYELKTCKLFAVHVVTIKTQLLKWCSNR